MQKYSVIADMFWKSVDIVSLVSLHIAQILICDQYILQLSIYVYTMLFNY